MLTMDFRACFFCGEAIQGKRSGEHIFSDSFLGYIALKREKIGSALPKTTDYSRLKVPAHVQCNSQQGSRFETQILGLLRNLDANLDHPRTLHVQTERPLDHALKQAFCMWLAKLITVFSIGNLV